MISRWVLLFIASFVCTKKNDIVAAAASQEHPDRFPIQVNVGVAFGNQEFSLGSSGNDLDTSELCEFLDISSDGRYAKDQRMIEYLKERLCEISNEKKVANHRSLMKQEDGSLAQSESINLVAPEDNKNIFGSENCTESNENKVQIETVTDGFPSETSFDIRDNNGTVILHQKDLSEANKSYKLETCLLSGCYTLNVYDENGDGICCEHGDGSVTLSLNSVEFWKAPKKFTDRVTKKFCVGILTESPTADPTSQPTNSFHPSIAFTEIPSMAKTIEPTEVYKTFETCQDKPPLFPLDSSGLKRETNPLLLALSVSDSADLTNTSSAQFQAACWIVHQDSLYDDEVSRTFLSMLQRYILAVLYFSTHGETWKDSFGFLSEAHECEWHNSTVDRLGVYCNVHKEIDSIILNENNLFGIIPKELSSLKKLRHLDLSHNGIEQSIPPSFGDLIFLEVLSLNNNEMQNNIPVELLTAESHLKHLSLQNNKITGSIPHQIGNLKLIETLSLSDNELEGSIPEEMYSLESLISLILSNNNLSSTLSVNIGQLGNLKELDLRANLLSGSLPKEIGFLSSLVKLDLSQNSFSGEIPDSLGYFKNIKMLYLQENNLVGQFPESLCEYRTSKYGADCRNDIFPSAVSCSCCDICIDESPIWKSSCADVKIDVMIQNWEYYHNTSSSQFTYEWYLKDARNTKILWGVYDPSKLQTIEHSACVAFTDCLEFDVKTKNVLMYNYSYSIFLNDRLAFQTNTYKDYGTTIQHPLLEFGFNSQNETMSIGSCDTASVCGDTLEDPMHQLMYNKALTISGRSALSDTQSYQNNALCWMLKKDEELDSVESINSRFIQRYILVLLNEMSDGKKLFRVGGHQSLKGHECQWLGVSCTNLTDQLLNISLTNEQYFGSSLPSEIGYLSFLQTLNVSDSGVEGTIPQTLKNLWSLEILDLSFNSITGEMPPDTFEDLKKVQTIDLSKNGLKGTLPSSIFRYTEILLIDSNDFSGTLHLTGADLRIFNAKNNSFAGQFPHKVRLHKNLEILDLSSNFLVGTLPENLFGSLPNLEQFDVSKNEFFGSIPNPSLYGSDEPRLKIFNIQVNRFRGSIPDLSSLTQLRQLNFQGNQLSSTLPSFLGSLHNLELISLAHNNFKGRIGELDVSGLTNLTALLLHSNSGLTGEASRFHDKNKIVTYITDCGFPSLVENAVSCSDCTICCNSENQCQLKAEEERNSTNWSIAFLVISASGIVVLYITRKQLLMKTKLFPVNPEWDARELIGDESCYYYLLSKNRTGWLIGLSISFLQLMTLFLFVYSADITKESSDLEYTMTCSKYSIDCQDDKSVSFYGVFIFVSILGGFILKDLVLSVKLFLLALDQSSLDYLLVSVITFTVSAFSIWTSIYYNVAIAVKNTDLIVNAVILLFVNEIDERIHSLCCVVNEKWVRSVEASISDTVENKRGRGILSASYYSKEKFIIEDEDEDEDDDHDKDKDQENSNFSNSGVGVGVDDGISIDLKDLDHDKGHVEKKVRF